MIIQYEYRILFYQICIFKFAVKLGVADFINKKNNGLTKFKVLEKTCVTSLE